MTSSILNSGKDKKKLFIHGSIVILKLVVTFNKLSHAVLD